MTRNKGTRDVSPGPNVNICTGCSHDCIYCYARKMAMKKGSKRGGIDSISEWKNMRIREKDVKKKYIKKWGYAPLFPSSHDITPEILDSYLMALGNFLEPGNEVIVVSKPHFACIDAICKKFDGFRDKITFMFTITGMNEDIRAFWEPGAPSYNERLKCLGHVHSQGFKTQAFVEPILDPDRLEELVSTLLLFSTGDIWVGRMHHIGKIKKMYPDRADIHEALDDLNRNITDERLRLWFQHFKENDQVLWKSGTLPKNPETPVMGQNVNSEDINKQEAGRSDVTEKLGDVQDVDPDEIVLHESESDEELLDFDLLEHVDLEDGQIGDYTIDPIAKVYPDMGKEDFEGLKNSIKQNGLRHPIVLKDGKVVDGKNRLKACLELGIEPQTVAWDGEGSVIEFVVDMNHNRRNLTKSQRAMIAVDLKRHYAIEAHERMLAGKKVDPVSKLPQGQKGSARALAANRLGVSETYVRDAEFLENQDPYLAESVRDGSMTLSQGFKELEKQCRVRACNEDVGYIYVEFDLPANVYLTAKSRGPDSNDNEVVAQVKFRNTNTANTDVLTKVAEQVKNAKIKTVSFRPTQYLDMQLENKPGVEESGRKLERIYGVNNMMIIAPHGVFEDDQYTGVVAREMARNLRCHAIINEVIPKSEMDLNDVRTLSDEVKKQLIDPMVEFSEEWKSPFIVLIHGCKDEYAKKNDILMGFGQGEPKRLTIDSHIFGEISKTAKRNKLKMVSAEKGSGMRARTEHNLNQFFKGEVNSIQLEIKLTGFRDRYEHAIRTGKKLAKVFGVFLSEEKVTAEPGTVEYRLLADPKFSGPPSLELKVSRPASGEAASLPDSKKSVSVGR